MIKKRTGRARRGLLDTTQGTWTLTHTRLDKNDHKNPRDITTDSQTTAETYETRLILDKPYTRT